MESQNCIRFVVVYLIKFNIQRGRFVSATNTLIIINGKYSLVYRVSQKDNFETGMAKCIKL